MNSYVVISWTNRAGDACKRGKPIKDIKEITEHVKDIQSRGGTINYMFTSKNGVRTPIGIV